MLLYEQESNPATQEGGKDWQDHIDLQCPLNPFLMDC